MSIITVLYLLIIQPLMLLLEFFFSVAFKLSDSAGIAVIFLSVIVNILVFPLYKRADELQNEVFTSFQGMDKWTKHIKRTFHGDERFMILQTCYRQFGYKPVYVMRGALPLLLQIPFFIAAYRFLSELAVLRGTSFLFLKDMGLPDALVSVGGNRINILPVLMTIVNLISALIYTKNKTFSQKIQPIVLAFVFLFLLYDSPSGLVFYWLLNNVFSLLKNALSNVWETKRKCLKSDGIISQDTHRGFFVGALSMATLTGVVIPTSVIKASPGEFVNALDIRNPLIYVAYSALLAVGLFVLWIGLYYLLSGSKGRTLIVRILWCLNIVSLIDYLCVGTNLGLISSSLRYDFVNYSVIEIIINAFQVIAVVSLTILVIQKKEKVVFYAVGISCAACLILGLFNIEKIQKSYLSIVKLGEMTATIPKYELSKTGKNVVVIMVDKAIGPLVPYIFEEKPELKDQFDGFTYYENTLSFGVVTKTASPAVFGGYEYTPEKINERSDESLESKHNEALKVMPVLFEENGYDVSVYDPPFAGYEQIPDLSIYDDYPSIHSYIANGKYSPFGEKMNERVEEVRKRNFFCYAIFKASPALLQEMLYDDGNYNDMNSEAGLGEVYGVGKSLAESMTVFQTIEGLSIASGYPKIFADGYYVLDNLSKQTSVNETAGDTFWMFYNSAAHDSCYLQKPEYVPSLYVDNTNYDVNMNYEIDGETMHMDNTAQRAHYHVNMATYIQLGKWFDTLRELGVYDNTRIIIVADHGCNLGFFDNILPDNAPIEYASPVLMMKDFDATGFELSDEFMTNADVPTMAMQGLIENPINPFTGNEISNNEKTEKPQHVTFSMDMDVGNETDNTFFEGKWYSVREDMRDPDNWEYIGTY